MNACEFNENGMEFKGELKQQWDKFTDEDLEQIEGFLDRFIVKVQERYGYGEVIKKSEMDHCRTTIRTACSPCVFRNSRGRSRKPSVKVA
jgi:uncharacterized protein YjbJ (UPF0337 family)